MLLQQTPPSESKCLHQNNASLTAYSHRSVTAWEVAKPPTEYFGWNRILNVRKARYTFPIYFLMG